MNLAVVLGSGSVLGLLAGVGVYADPRVPGKLQIVAASTLRGALVALLTAYSLAAAGGGAPAALGFGALYGLLFGLVVCLSKGEGAFEHARYILPVATVTCALAALPIAWWGLS